MKNKVNLNVLAKDVTLAEGGKMQLPIGQVKEVIRLTLLALQSGYQPSAILQVVEIQK